MTERGTQNSKTQAPTGAGQLDPETERLQIEAALARTAPRIVAGATGILDLKRLSGGASQETWAFDLALPETSTLPLILRRAPGGQRSEGMGTGPGLSTEAAVIRACASHGVPVPDVRYVLGPDDGLGEGYIMGRVEGETIARRILRDPALAEARAVMAGQCGTILARLHRVPGPDLPALDTLGPRAQWQRYREIYDGFADPRPVFDYAFRWLDERLPETEAGPWRLVHGDFRNGNLMVGVEGVRAVLDWELCHLGDPMEDLGWICINSWRFGQSHKPVGGFGALEDLIAAYEAEAGHPVDRDRIHLWTVFGSLKWGIMCLIMADAFRSGADRSVERAAIGRRASEAEIDLMTLLAPFPAPHPTHDLR